MEVLSFPLRERGLKRAGNVIHVSLQLSFPLRERGLKLLPGHSLRPPPASSFPLRERGLKREIEEEEKEWQ